MDEGHEGQPFVVVYDHYTLDDFERAIVTVAGESPAVCRACSAPPVRAVTRATDEFGKTWWAWVVEPVCADDDHLHPTEQSREVLHVVSGQWLPTPGHPVVRMGRT